MFGVAMVSLLVAGLVAASTADQCLSHAKLHSDGCSIPFHLPYFFKHHFTPSCMRHDICYSCGLRNGVTRSQCDRAFFHAINVTCGNLRRDLHDLPPATVTRAQLRDVVALSRDPVARKRFLFTEADFCRLVSDTYYESVHLFAAGHFNIPSESFCGEEWVTSCLPETD